ncbi:MAG: hypothetical protein ACK5MA_10150 [Parachlamydiaceae bacterium]
MDLIKKLDQSLLDLIWSLWTELGVQGHKRKHQDCLISLEELVLLTTTLVEIDPRLRDESLDWCSKYHHFISVSRLKTLLKEYDTPILEAFSKYSSTLNSISRAHWPIFQEFTPIKIHLSHKSYLRPLEFPALLNIRARSVFGTGARADLIVFFLTHGDVDFSISDTVEIGYSKRNLAEILEELWLGGLVDQSLLRNQQRYRLLKKGELLKILGPLPKYLPSWRHFIEVIIPIRMCLQKIKNFSESTQAIEIQNLLISMHPKLKKLKILPPSFDGDFSKYMNSFNQWLLDFSSQMSETGTCAVSSRRRP